VLKERSNGICRGILLDSFWSYCKSPFGSPSGRTTAYDASFVPETKNRTLEELDRVFGGPAGELIGYACEQVIYFVWHTLLRQNMAKPVHRGEEKRRGARRRLIDNPDPVCYDDPPGPNPNRVTRADPLPPW